MRSTILILLAFLYLGIVGCQLPQSVIDSAITLEKKCIAVEDCCVPVLTEEVKELKAKIEKEEDPKIKAILEAEMKKCESVKIDLPKITRNIKTLRLLLEKYNDIMPEEKKKEADSKEDEEKKEEPKEGIPIPDNTPAVQPTPSIVVKPGD